MTNRSNDADAKMQQGDEPMYAADVRRGGSQRQSIGETAAKSFIRSIAWSLGRVLVRAITGRIR